MPDKSYEEAVREAYDITNPRLIRLAETIKDALESLLTEAGIKPQYIAYRIKTFESFWEKIRLKRYKYPFKQATDLCGIRIVAFFRQDVNEISSIILKEFDIHEVVQTEETQEVDRFGYRDDKYVVSVKEDWLKSPIYRGLRLHDLIAEIQVRSILTHAWAELSHKLVYKRTEGLPKAIVRDINRSSALLEELDAKFDDLRGKKEAYQAEIKQKAEATPDYWKNLPLNADSVQALLDHYYPDREKSDSDVGILLQDLHATKMTMEELVQTLEGSKDEVCAFEDQNLVGGQRLTQRAAANYACLSNQKWWDRALRRMQEKGSL
jgi:putative GTP pyrophosphokinase